MYICNVVKCRPPENRTPREEQEKCRIYLDAQFELVNPQVIVCLGSTPARALIHPDIRITKARGMWHLKRGIYIMPTYHPAAILYDPTKEQASLYDISVVREKLRELRIYDQLSMGTEGNA